MPALEVNLTHCSTPKLQEIYVQAQELLRVRNLATEPQMASLYETISSVVLTRTGKSSPPFFAFKRTAGYKQLLDNTPAFESLIKEAKPRTTQAIALRRIYINALVTCMVANKIPVSAGTCCKMLKWVPKALDIEFPGYRASGLLPLIVRSMSK